MVMLKYARLLLLLVLLVLPFGLASCAGPGEPAGTADDPFVDDDGNKLYIDDDGWTIHQGLVYSSQIIRKINLDMTVQGVTRELGTPSAEDQFGSQYLYYLSDGGHLMVGFFVSEGLVAKSSDKVHYIMLCDRGGEIIAEQYRKTPQSEIEYDGIWPVN